MMAELDAAFFLLYGIERDDVQYILSTFKGISSESDQAETCCFPQTPASWKPMTAWPAVGNDHIHQSISGGFRRLYYVHRVPIA